MDESKALISALFFGFLYAFLHLFLPAIGMHSKWKEDEARGRAEAWAVVFKGIVYFFIGHAVWILIVSALKHGGMDVEALLKSYLGFKNASPPSDWSF